MTKERPTNSYATVEELASHRINAIDKIYVEAKESQKEIREHNPAFVVEKFSDIKEKYNKILSEIVNKPDESQNILHVKHRISACDYAIGFTYRLENHLDLEKSLDHLTKSYKLIQEVLNEPSRSIADNSADLKGSTIESIKNVAYTISHTKENKPASYDYIQNLCKKEEYKEIAEAILEKFAKQEFEEAKDLGMNDNALQQIEMLNKLFKSLEVNTELSREIFGHKLEIISYLQGPMPEPSAPPAEESKIIIEELKSLEMDLNGAKIYLVNIKTGVAGIISDIGYQKIIAKYEKIQEKLPEYSEHTKSVNYGIARCLLYMNSSGNEAGDLAFNYEERVEILKKANYNIEQALSADSTNLEYTKLSENIKSRLEYYTKIQKETQSPESSPAEDCSDLPPPPEDIEHSEAGDFGDLPPPPSADELENIIPEQAEIPSSALSDTEAETTRTPPPVPSRENKIPPSQWREPGYKCPGEFDIDEDPDSYFQVVVRDKEERESSPSPDSQSR